MKEYLHLFLKIGAIMTESGAEISRVEASLSHMCRAYGVTSVSVYATTSNIIVTVEDKDGEVYTETRRPDAIGNNFTLLDRVNDLVRHISETAPDAAEIREAIRALPRKTWRWFVVAPAQGAISASFCLFFGSRSVAECLFAFLIGASLCCLGRLFDRVEANRLLKSFLLTFLASLAAFTVTRLGWVASPDFIIIGYIMNLIPGLGLTGAIRDLFVGDLFTGMVRILSAVLIAVSIAVGFILNLLLFKGMPSSNPMAMPGWDQLLEIVAATVGTVGFAYVFNTRGKKIFFAAFGGCLGWVLFLLLGLFMDSEILRYLIVSVLVSVYGEIMARVLKTPTTLFSVVCLVPLVPGSGLYYTMTHALNGNWAEFLDRGPTTLGLAAALSLGTVLVNTLAVYVKKFLARQKKHFTEKK